jgi:hypothetical protein
MGKRSNRCCHKSIDGFDVITALENMRDVLVRYG